MRRGIAISAVVATLTVATASVTPAAASPRLVRGSAGITLEIASVNGSGCPRGSVNTVGKDNEDAFFVGYGQFIAQAGGSSNPTDSRKACQLALKVGGIPKGFTYAVSSVDYYGFAYLTRPRRTAAAYSTGFSFSGQPTRAEEILAFESPWNHIWTATRRVSPDDLVFKPCDEEPTFNIESELWVNAGTSDPSEVDYVSVGYERQAAYHLTWKPCP
jgi:hypothetical protein